MGVWDGLAVGVEVDVSVGKGCSANTCGVDEGVTVDEAESTPVSGLTVTVIIGSVDVG